MGTAIALPHRIVAGIKDVTLVRSLAPGSFSYQENDLILLYLNSSALEQGALVDTRAHYSESLGRSDIWEPADDNMWADVHSICGFEGPLQTSLGDRGDLAVDSGPKLKSPAQTLVTENKTIAAALYSRPLL